MGKRSVNKKCDTTRHHYTMVGSLSSAGFISEPTPASLESRILSQCRPIRHFDEVHRTKSFEPEFCLAFSTPTVTTLFFSF
jgi:hypothetical protein